MTITRRIWTNPRTQPKTVPQEFGLVACIDIAGRLLVIVEGPRSYDDVIHSFELQAEGPDGPLLGELIECTGDRNGTVLVGEFDSPPPSDGDLWLPIVLRIDNAEKLRVGALLSRTLS